MRTCAYTATVFVFHWATMPPVHSRVPPRVMVGCKEKKSSSKKISFFFLKLVLAWKCLTSIGFEPNPHSMGCGDRIKSKVDPSWDLSMALWFLGHISLKNGSNLNLRVSLESRISQVHYPCIEHFFPAGQCHVNSQLLTFNSFFFLFLEKCNNVFKIAKEEIRK
jgi:hypothetical protein